MYGRYMQFTEFSIKIWTILKLVSSAVERHNVKMSVFVFFYLLTTITKKVIQKPVNEP